MPPAGLTTLTTYRLGSSVLANKRGTIGWLIAAGSFALAFRRKGRRQSKALKPLKPGGMRDDVPARREVHTDVGRGAVAPQAIPGRGWWAIAKRTAQKFSQNELMSEAASVTFYALLSLVPAITATVSLYGLVADPSTIEKQLDAGKSVDEVVALSPTADLDARWGHGMSTGPNAGGVGRAPIQIPLVWAWQVDAERG